MKRRRLHLRADAIRILTDLRDVIGGHPSSFPQCPLARTRTSEAVDGEPCPGEYSYVCRP